MRLFSYPQLFFLLLICSLSSCALFQKKPETHATGYLAERGVVRIWQHTTPSGFIALDSLFTPFDGTDEVETTYLWDQQQLIHIDRKSLGAHEDSMTVRFSRTDGTTSFMQQTTASTRRPLTLNEIELAKFEAQRLLDVSRDLISGRIELHQGHWLSSQQVENCQGGVEYLDLGSRDYNRLTGLSQQSKSYVAWLEAPEGRQVLLTTSRNLCQQQPDFSQHRG